MYQKWIIINCWINIKNKLNKFNNSPNRIKVIQWLNFVIRCNNIIKTPKNRWQIKKNNLLIKVKKFKNLVISPIIFINITKINGAPPLLTSEMKPLINSNKRKLIE